MDIQPQPNTIYTGQRSEKLQVSEAERLQTMDAFLAEITRSDLEPAFAYVQAGSMPGGISFLDVGAGPSRATELLCGEMDSQYYAADISQKHLDMRVGMDSSHKILANAEALPILSNTFHLTFSRALMGWVPNPEKAVAEQLRVTKPGGVATFTEFDWERAGAPHDSEAAKTIMQLKATMLFVLSMGHFETDFGRELGGYVERAAVSQGLEYQRVSKKHELDPGDYRAILFDAVRSIRFQMEEMDPEHKGRIGSAIGMLDACTERIKEARRCTIFLPTLFTETVYITGKPDAE